MTAAMIILGYWEEGCRLGLEDVCPGRMKEGSGFILNGSSIPLFILTNALKLLLLSSSSSSTVASKGGGDGVNDCFGVIGRKNVGSVRRMYFLGE